MSSGIPKETGTPKLKSTITHEALARVAKAPTTFAAWVLRAVACELQDVRKDLAWALNELRMRTDVPPVLDRVNEIQERYRYADWEPDWENVTLLVPPAEASTSGDA